MGFGFVGEVMGQGEEPALRELAAGRFMVGGAVRAAELREPRLAALVRRQFNCLTAEVEFMPHRVAPERETFQFGPADEIAAFAEQNGIALMGHMLLWHYRSPAWLFTDAKGKPLPRNEALANLETYITTVMSHFRGRVHAWAVVNEALSDDPDEFFRSTPAYEAIGDDYVIKAFEFARKADPSVRLYYNDYNLEEPAKLEKAIRLIRDLQLAGQRLDAIGVQGHYLLDYPPANRISNALSRLANEGVDVMITELDVDLLPRTVSGANMERVESGPNPYSDGLPDAVQQQLATRYAEIFSVFLKQPAVKSVTFWGTHDGSSWLNEYPVRGRTNHPLLWDRDYRPKPAFDAVAEILAGEERRN